MNPRTLLAIGALLALTSFGLAQDLGGGNHAPGQGRGGRGMMRGGGGALGLLQRDDVQTELKLTAEQKTKLTALRDQMRQEMRSAFQMAQGDRAAMQKTIQSLAEKTQRAATQILTPEQRTRLMQLNVQRSGPMVVLDPAMQKELALTPDQVKKINDLQSKMNEANQAVFEKARSGEIQREEIRTTMEKNRATLNTEIEKVLTDAQKTKLKGMAGTPFAFKQDE